MATRVTDNRRQLLLLPARLRKPPSWFEQSRANDLRLSRPSGVGYAVREFSRACLIRLIDYPEMPLRTSTRETVKAGRSALLVRTELPVGDRMVPVAYKRVTRRTWLKRLTGLTRENRTLRTWRLGQLLRAQGIATARPLAVIVPRRYHIFRPTYLAQEWIEGARNLHEFGLWADDLDVQNRFQTLRTAADALGKLLGRMHAGNISHRDLKLGNLLLVGGGPTVRAYVIDLDGARAGRSVSRKTRIRNLSRLVVGLSLFPGLERAHRLRFLKAYLRACDDSTWQWKDAWRQLAESSSRLRIRKERKSKRSR